MSNGVTVLVLTRVADAEKPLGALTAKSTGSPRKCKPAAWGKFNDPSHLLYTLDGCDLDDIKFLASQTAQAHVFVWAELADSPEATLKNMTGGAIELHPLAE